LTPAEPGISERAKDIETASESGSVIPPDSTEIAPGASPARTPAEAIDVPSKQQDQDISPMILPSSIDSRISEISEGDAERRGSAPKTLAVAPKIARLQAEIATPSASSLRKPTMIPTSQGPSPTSSPPATRTRNLSVQSSESDDGPGPTDTRKDVRSAPRLHLAASKIPKAKPPQPLTAIHGRNKSIDNTSESRHKSRNPSEDNTDRAARTKPHKQFMSNTIKKLQRAAGTDKSVSSLAKHFDELSRQYEKEEIKRRKRFGYRRAFPVTSAKPRVEVFRTFKMPCWKRRMTNWIH